MKSDRCRFLPAVSCLLLSFLLAHGVFSTNPVTLESILIYTSHKWLPLQPTVYFRCHRENKIILPDVKDTYVLYNYTSEELWQPLTELPSKKCKRCGIYEADRLENDDVFDEWELCPGDFVDKKYIHFKAKEFIATFRCNSCASFESGSDQNAGKMKNIAVVIVVGVSGSIIVIVALVVGYKYWLKKKKVQNQASFVKLSEEADDMEHELGMRNVNCNEGEAPLKTDT